MNASWKVNGLMKQAYDKSVKGYTYIIDKNTRLIAPRDSRKQNLQLIQPFIILQCRIIDRASFYLEVGFSDTENVKRRLIFYGGSPYSYTKNNMNT